MNDSPTDYLERYLTLTQSGITAFSCNVTFTYLPADIHGTETGIYGKLYAGSVWTTLGQAGGNQFTGTVTAFGDFTGADHTPAVAAPLSDMTVSEDSSPASINLSGVFSDFDDDNAAIVKTLTSDSNPGLLSAAVSGYTLTLNYAPDGNGTAVIVIRGMMNGSFSECGHSGCEFCSVSDRRCVRELQTRKHGKDAAGHGGHGFAEGETWRRAVRSACADR